MLFDKLQDILLLISMAVILGIVLIHYRPWKRELERNKRKIKSSKRKT